MRQEDISVIFDMDGTIFDTERLVLDCWERIGEKHGISGIREVFMRCIGTNKVRTQEIVYAHYGKDFLMKNSVRKAPCCFTKSRISRGFP